MKFPTFCLDLKMSKTRPSAIINVVVFVVFLYISFYLAGLVQYNIENLQVYLIFLLHLILCEFLIAKQLKFMTSQIIDQIQQFVLKVSLEICLQHQTLSNVIVHEGLRLKKDQYPLYFIQILEQMEKGFRNVTNLPANSQADRIKQIEQKLQYIAEVKSAQQRQEKANTSNLKVTGLQKLANETFRRFETQLREQRELINELTREYEENKSEQGLLLKNRLTEINELQARFANIWKTEMQRTRECERKIITSYQQKMESLKIAINKQVERRKQYFTMLNSELSGKLPSLQAQITQKMQQSSLALSLIHQQIEEQSENICHQLKQSQSTQLTSFEELMKMMGSVIAEVKDEVASEKQNRMASKKKLLSLFQGAYSKLIN